MKTDMKIETAVNGKNLFRRKISDPLLILTVMFILAYILYSFFPHPVIK